MLRRAGAVCPSKSDDRRTRTLLQRLRCSRAHDRPAALAAFCALLQVALCLRPLSHSLSTRLFTLPLSLDVTHR